MIRNLFGTPCYTGSIGIFPRMGQGVGRKAAGRQMFLQNFSSARAWFQVSDMQNLNRIKQRE